MRTPSSRSINFIILLGIVSAVLFSFFLLNDLKQNGGYWSKYYRVIDSTDRQNPKLVDSFIVIHQKQMEKDSATLAHFAQATKGGDFGYRNLLFDYNPAMLVWVAFYVLTFALSIVLMPFLIGTIHSIQKSFSIKRKTIITLVVTCLLVGVIMNFTSSSSKLLLTAVRIMQKFEILLQHPYVMMYVVILSCLIAGLLGFFGQLMINEAITLLLKKRDQDVDILRQKFSMLHKNLKFILVATAALIVLSILSTNAMKRSINAEISTSIDIFPSSFVYMYGLVFTFYLAIFYLPIFYRLKMAGESLSSKSKETGDEKSASEFLIRETPLENFVTVFSILSPIITSLAPDILKF